MPSDAVEPSDEEIVRRARAGDDAAARLLFDRHLPALRAHAAARLPAAVRGKIAASDVIQDALLSAFQTLADFEDRGDGSFARWLRGILDHKLGDASRRHVAGGKRDVRREVRLPRGSESGAPATPLPSPSEGAVAREESATVRRAVDGLPDDYRTVIQLVHREGLSLVDAGRRMGRSADAVRKLYGRAIACLEGQRLGGDATP